MGDLAKEILPVNIEDEMKQSYLDYAMSVIVGERFQMCGTASSPCTVVCSSR